MGKTVRDFYVGGDKLTEEQIENMKTQAAIREEEIQKMRDKIDALRKEGLAVIDVMNVNFEPFEDRVLVFPDPVEEVTAGGIYKPDVALAKARPLIGVIIKVGPGKDRPMPLAQGDRIIFGTYAGTEVTFNGLKYLIMRFTDIFGKETTDNA